jgi:hypothetical protein
VAAPASGGATAVPGGPVAISGVSNNIIAALALYWCW